MKINLGSGYKRYAGFLNVDDDPLVEPDFLVNICKEKLPFEDNSVDEMICHHILEHIGDEFIPLMQEIYRVCSHGAIIHIEVPHPLHEIFLNDPTHKRPITVEGMRMFSKKYNRSHIESHGSSSGMGLKFNVDFEIINFNYVHDPFYSEYIESYNTRQQQGQTSKDEDWAFVRLFREGYNVAMLTQITMVVVKDE